MRCVFTRYLIRSLQQPYEAAIIFISVLLRKTLRQKGSEQLAQGHRACRRQSLIQTELVEERVEELRLRPALIANSRLQRTSLNTRGLCKPQFSHLSSGIIILLPRRAEKWDCARKKAAQC